MRTAVEPARESVPAFIGTVHWMLLRRVLRHTALGTLLITLGVITSVGVAWALELQADHQILPRWLAGPPAQLKPFGWEEPGTGRVFVGCTWNEIGVNGVFINEEEAQYCRVFPA